MGGHFKHIYIHQDHVHKKAIGMNSLIDLNYYRHVSRNWFYKNYMEKKLYGHYKIILYILIVQNYLNIKMALSNSLCFYINKSK
jgi:hypothetical protein